MSARTNNGTTMPVDCLAPNANAIIVTFKTAIPLIPAFDKPIINVAIEASIQAVGVISVVIDRSTWYV